MENGSRDHLGDPWRISDWWTIVLLGMGWRIGRREETSWKREGVVDRSHKPSRLFLPFDSPSSLPESSPRSYHVAILDTWSSIPGACVKNRIRGYLTRVRTFRWNRRPNEWGRVTCLLSTEERMVAREVCECCRPLCWLEELTNGNHRRFHSKCVEGGKSSH